MRHIAQRGAQRRERVGVEKDLHRAAHSQRQGVGRRQPGLQFDGMLVCDHHHLLAGDHRPAQPLVGVTEQCHTVAWRRHRAALVERTQVAHLGAFFVHLALQHRQLRPAVAVHQRALAPLSVIGLHRAQRAAGHLQPAFQTDAVELQQRIARFDMLVGLYQHPAHHAVQRRPHHGRVQWHQFGRRQQRQRHGQRQRGQRSASQRQLQRRAGQTGGAPGTLFSRRVGAQPARPAAARHAAVGMPPDGGPLVEQRQFGVAPGFVAGQQQAAGCRAVRGRPASVGRR